MPHYRSQYRAAVRAAVAEYPDFSDVTVLRVWPGSVDVHTLPVLGVVTPNEPTSRDSYKSTTRRTLLQVVLRRAGGDEVEDRLDDDSAVIEALVNRALRSAQLKCQLEDTSVVSHTQAEAIVGTLIMSFRLQSWRPDATLT